MRWSPGSIIILIILTVINVLLLLGGLLIPSHLLFYTFFIGLAVELLIIIIKGFENLVIMENKPFTYEEKTGIALTDIYPGRDGVVKIKNELWSARSNERIKKNEKIIVERQEGLYLIVKKIQ